MPGNKSGNPKKAGPRQRLTYVNIRMQELREELKRLNSEREELRKRIEAQRAGQSKG